MITDSSGSGRRVHILKLWGGLLIWICGTLAFFTANYIYLKLKCMIFHIRSWDWNYVGFTDLNYYMWFGVLLLLSLYQMFLYKWKKSFGSIFWRCVFIALQIFVSAVFTFFVYVIFLCTADYQIM